MSEVTFTYEWYKNLLTRIKRGFEFAFFDSSIRDETVFLRHDVDFSPEKAHKIAVIESELGVYSTYFFLLNSPVYNLLTEQNGKILSKIDDLGHRIGLHFHTSRYWDEEPSKDELREKIDRELNIIAEIVDNPTDVIAFHNPPNWVLGAEFPSFRHTYEPQYFEDIRYEADSNQRWRADPPFKPTITAPSQVLTHPFLWGEYDRTKNEHLEDIVSETHDQIERYARQFFLDS